VDGVAQVARLRESVAVQTLIRGLTQIYGEEAARQMASQWSEGLRRFAGPIEGSGGNDPTNGEGGPGNSGAPP